MKYTVYLMTPYCSWEDIEAKDEAEAIDQCNYPPEFDLNEGSHWVAIEQEDDRCLDCFDHTQCARCVDYDCFTPFKRAT